MKMQNDKLLRKRKPHSEETKRKMRESALKRDNTNLRKHGFSAEYPKLYEVWTTMKGRCENPNRQKYKDYGARGIKVCDEWHDAEVFCKWALENGYKEGLQIDRIDVNGNYEPSNCRWADAKTQANNRRDVKKYTYNGKTLSVSEWAREVGKPRATIEGRLLRGWTIERALTEEPIDVFKRGWKRNSTLMKGE
jgi:hypothetical protein